MKKWRCLVKIFLTALLLVGCRQNGEPVNAEISFSEVPDYSYLLRADPEETDSLNRERDYPPVHVYMSNTANMRYFVFSGDQELQVDSHLVNLMCGIHDMERVYGKTSYYTLQKSEDPEMLPIWTKYQTGEGMEERPDFLKPGFYLDQKESDEAQPLSMLYGMGEGEWSPENINIVITDMAERNMELEDLAKRIRDMCQENRCDAYLLVFQPEYYGKAIVPKPKNPEILIEKKVEGTRPYYLMITGPSYCMEKYMDSFLNCLRSLQLTDGEDFQKIRFHMGQEETKILPDQITVLKDAEDGNASGIIYDEKGEKESGVLELRFACRPDKDMANVQKDWGLHFKVSLDMPAEKYISNYGEKIQCYQLKQSAGGTKEDLDSGQWIKIEDSKVKEEIRCSSSSVDIRLSGSSELLHTEPELESQVLLIILTITYKEEHPYKMPEWVECYNSVSEEDCGEKTYGLEKLFEILFGCEWEQEEMKTISLERTYGEIPILIFEQEESERDFYREEGGLGFESDKAE